MLGPIRMGHVRNRSKGPSRHQGGGSHSPRSGGQGGGGNNPGHPQRSSSSQHGQHSQNPPQGGGRGGQHPQRGGHGPGGHGGGQRTGQGGGHPAGGQRRHPGGGGQGHSRDGRGGGMPRGDGQGALRPGVPPPPVGEPTEGLLEIFQGGFGYLRRKENNYVASTGDVYVPANVLRVINVREGTLLRGVVSTVRGPQGQATVQEVQVA